RGAARGSAGREGARERADGGRPSARRADRRRREGGPRLVGRVKKYLLVGLTGSIATGKSTVSNMFRALGCEIIDADLLAREIVEPGEPALAQIVDAFGRDVLQPDRTLDRKKLGAIIFADPARRKT